MNRTPLHAEHIARGARMGTFGGWAMPIQYRGIPAEHDQTRHAAGLFDVSHMGEFEVCGPAACSDLERLLTLDPVSLQIGQCRYGFVLNEQGGVIDDLTCYRLGAQRYMLVVNASRCEAVALHTQPRLSPTTRFVDRSAELAKIDLQGPCSRRVLEDAANMRVPDLGYFHAAPCRVAGCDLLLSRTGYTGEFGYELYLPASEAVRIWRLLLDHPDLEPVGLGARDTLRLEMGYPLYGHELLETCTPVVVTGGAFIRKRGGFIGEEAVRRELESPEERLVGVQMESRRAARAGDRLYEEGGCAPVGVVTSGAYAPSIGRAVALARVNAGCAVPGRVFEVEIRAKRYRGVATRLPFYQEGSARKKICTEREPDVV